jgi:APA family basic amino acid/polyamine antiporter
MSVQLKNKIGLLGGVGLVIGGVIGMGAYALIPGIVANAGPAAWLAITIALIVSLLSALPLIQLSSAMPVAGGGYEYCKRLLSPYTGYMVSWLAILGGASSVSLISIGLADEFKDYIPMGIPPHVASILFVAGFYLFYLLGLKIVTMFQLLLCVQLLAALCMYFIPIVSSSGFVMHAGMPETTNFLLAVILAFNISLGFQIIIELGEEMKRPERNIPLSLLIGGAMVLFIYLAISFAYIYAIGIEHMSEKIKLMTTALPYHSHAGIIFIRIGIISAGLTSYSGAAIALSREVFALARAGALPSFWHHVDKRGEPSRAVGFFFCIVITLMSIGYVLERADIISTYFGDEVVEFYGFLTIFGIMILTIVLSVAALRLPKLMPAEYQSAYLRFPKWVLFPLCILSILSCLFLLAVIFTKVIIVLIYILVFIGISALYLLYSKKRITL